MHATWNVAIVIGSLRQGSISRKLASALAAIAPASMKLEIADIAELALYNPDLDDNPPAPWRAFKQRIAAADAVLFITPEHNRSLPAALKNAIDIASRPYGQSAWSGKPAAIITISPGAMGGFGANHQLRQSLVFLDMPVLQQPEAYLGNAAQLINEAGEIADAAMQDRMRKFLHAFEGWIERVQARPLQTQAR